VAERVDEEGGVLHADDASHAGKNKSAEGADRAIP
jgi:hypothetical protein